MTGNSIVARLFPQETAQRHSAGSGGRRATGYRYSPGVAAAELFGCDRARPVRVYVAFRILRRLTGLARDGQRSRNGSLRSRSGRGRL
jgi:hypothetical protein